MPKRKSLIEPNEIIEDLRAERIRKGWSKSYLAERAGVHPNSISDWERGDHVPPFDKVIVWARALGYELELTRRGL